MAVGEGVGVAEGTGVKSETTRRRVNEGGMGRSGSRFIVF